LDTFHSNSGKINPVTLTVSVPSRNKVCKVKATYQIELDIRKAIASKTSPVRKITGIEKITTNGKVETYYEYKNVVYTPKRKVFNFVPKLFSFELDSESAKSCKDEKAALLVFDLEKKGFIVDTSAL